MSARSSMQLLPLAALAACAIAVTPAVAASPAPSDAPPGAAAQPDVNDLPELGDPMPAEAPLHARLVVARMDLDTPVARLCADPRAKAVLDSDLPGLTNRPEFPFFKSMSLNTLRKMSRGRMSEADLAKVQAELARLDETPGSGGDQ